MSSESQQRFDIAVSSAYVEAIDRGEWFDPLRTGLDAYVNATSEQMTGTIRVRLFKGAAQVVGRKSICNPNLRSEMSKPLWSGRFDSAPDPAAFDFGVSFPFDRRLFEDDVTGSLAWAEALGARRRARRHATARRSPTA